MNKFKKNNVTQSYAPNDFPTKTRWGNVQPPSNIRLKKPIPLVDGPIPMHQYYWGDTQTDIFPSPNVQSPEKFNSGGIAGKYNSGACQFRY